MEKLKRISVSASENRASRRAEDADLLAAKRAQYRDILSDLAQLDTGPEASRVQNYNKRETLRLVDVIRGEEPQESAAWRQLESVVQAVRQPTVHTREEAIASLGHLFYLAGAQMTSMLDVSLEALLAVLRDPTCSEEQRLLAVKAIGEVCWCSADPGQRLHAQGGVQTLVECVYNFGQNTTLARWACHTLSVLLADNAEVWMYLRRLEALQRMLAALADQEQLWADWDNNHAAILHGLLYGPRPSEP